MTSPTRHTPGRRPSWPKSLALLAASVLVCLVLVELACRLLLDPVDYLQPRMVSHPVLGHAIEPSTGGHDAWGFRNRATPKTAEVVVVGDSQSYGLGVPRRNAWPSILARLAKVRVYNASLGGYGPLHYLYLVETRALKLNPKLIVVALYLGNDLVEAYNLAYRLDHWREFRNPKLISPPPPPPLKRELGPPLRRIRAWLAGRLVSYRLVVHALGGKIAAWLRGREAEIAGRGWSVLKDAAGRIVTAFDPPRRFRAVDLSDVRVAEGLKIGLAALEKIGDACHENGVELLFVLIPTKESVYAGLIAAAGPELKHRALLEKLIANEAFLRGRLEAFFREHDLAYLDLLEPLQAAARRRPVYPPTDDGHPNKDGHEVIARAVFKTIEQRFNFRAGPG